MNRIAYTAIVAIAGVMASRAVKRWLVERHVQVKRVRREPLESWENEGGALYPQYTMIETSQVPR